MHVTAIRKASYFFLVVLAIVPWTVCAGQTTPSSEQPKVTRSPEVDKVLDALFASIDAEEAKSTAPAKPTDKAWVKQRLQQMVNVNQIVRSPNPGAASWGPDARQYFYDRLLPRWDRIDRANTAELKDLLKIHGWFTISEFGKEADGNAWLLVQHADHDVAFQKQVLDILTELYPKGETSRSHYAYLWDRVAGHTGKKQRYGSQGTCTGPGTWELHDVEDPSGLDSRRASVGLPSMQVYKQAFKDNGLCP